MDLSKCSCSRNAVLPDSVQDQRRVFMDVTCAVGAAYRMLFDKQCDALRGLTVGLDCAAHVAVRQSSDIGIYN